MDDRPIIAAYDASEGAATALRWALDEGSRCGRPVCVTYVFDQDRSGPGTHMRGRDVAVARQEAVSAMRRVAAEAHDWGSRGIAVTGAVLDGPVARRLCERSRTASMVVMGARGLGGFAGLRIGSVSLRVATHAHCPVVVVREEVRMADHRPVAVGVDDSREGRLAVGFAMERAALRGIGLMAVRGCEPPPPQWQGKGDWLAPRYCEPDVSERQILDRIVASWRGYYTNVEVTANVAPVTAAHALTVASHGAQLMVIGSGGSGGFADLCLGSVSQQLLHHALCTVAVVHNVVASQDVAAAHDVAADDVTSPVMPDARTTRPGASVRPGASR
jgi:nucleotide-binding universal stress UspA family protein